MARGPALERQRRGGGIRDHRSRDRAHVRHERPDRPLPGGARGGGPDPPLRVRPAPPAPAGRLEADGLDRGPRSVSGGGARGAGPGVPRDRPPVAQRGGALRRALPRHPERARPAATRPRPLATEREVADAVRDPADVPRRGPAAGALGVRGEGAGAPPGLLGRRPGALAPTRPRAGRRGGRGGRAGGPEDARRAAHRAGESAPAPRRGGPGRAARRCARPASAPPGPRRAPPRGLLRRREPRPARADPARPVRARHGRVPPPLRRARAALFPPGGAPHADRQGAGHPGRPGGPHLGRRPGRPGGRGPGAGEARGPSRARPAHRHDGQ